MSEDYNKDELTPETPHPTGNDLPEPPPTWKSSNTNNVQSFDNDSQDDTPEDLPPQVGPLANKTIKISHEDKQLLGTARKYISISQVCAVVSVFIGGVLLSSIAVVFSVLALFKLNTFAASHTLDQQARNAFKRPAYLAVGLSVLVLVFNIVSLILIYPMVMEGLQTGDLSGIFGTGQGGSSPGASTSTWG